jgi:anti-anti-sigma regulatory factor
MENEKKRKLNIVIIGAGKGVTSVVGGTNILKMLHGDEEINIVGVVDIKDDAPGVKVAQKLGIPTAKDFEEFLEGKDVDVIFNTTGVPEVQERLEQIKPRGVEVMSGMGIKLLRDLLKERELTEDLLRHAIDELSKTPIIQVWDGILALPLIGTIDSLRAKKITENLLNYIVQTGSSIVIMDLTGAPIVDTQIANNLIKTARAVKLVGAQCILTGISPQIAQSLVNLGVNLDEIPTCATLRAGLKRAFEMLGIKVVPASS